MPSSLMEILRGRAAEAAGTRSFTFLDAQGAEAGSLSFGELDRRARCVAGALQECARPGERALLLYPPSLEFIVGFFGCLYAGIVAVPIYPPRSNRHQERLRAVVEDSGARVVLAPAAVVEQVSSGRGGGELAKVHWVASDTVPSESADAWMPIGHRPGDLAFLQYTSGSTSTPKGVMVTYGNLLHNEEMIRRAFRQDENSVVVGWLPLYHDMGLIGNVLQPLSTGGQAILMSPMTFLQRPANWLEAISRYRASTSGGPNFAYDLCVRKVTLEQRAALDLSTWTVAFNGAEPVRAETMRRFAETFAPCGFRPEAFFPCYGLAEATLFVTGGSAEAPPVVRLFSEDGLKSNRGVESGEGAPAGRELVGCGWPWEEQRIAIVDPESGLELPPGQVGEIWISGPSVASGYWRQPEESERVFRARLPGEEGSTFLRTGDLGFLHGGELFVTGRLKDLIILRGRNYYPHDIERTAEGSHPALRPGCGAAFSVEGSGSEEQLIVLHEVERRRLDAVEAAAILAAVQQAVAAEHDIRVEEVVLLRTGSLLKTSSGKIRRRACREAYISGELAVLARSGSGANLEEGESSPDPTNPGEGIQGFLTVYVAGILRTSPARIDPRIPLTALGLDSLAASELRTRVEERFGTALSLAWLLGDATLAEVAERIELSGGERVSLPASILSPRETAEIPLSPNQRALWLADQMSSASAAYNLAGIARIAGRLDRSALKRSFEILVDRHGALRTAFLMMAEEPVQRVLPRVELDWRVEEVSLEEIPDLDRRIRAEAFQPFDPVSGSLMRVRIWSLGEQEHRLLLVLHHLVSDFASIAILLGELSQAYLQETGGPPARWASPLLTAADAFRWKESELAGPRGEQLWIYWREQLAGSIPALDLSTDRPRPLSQTYAGDARTALLGAALSVDVNAFARRHRSTLFMALLTGFHALLQRYGQGELAIGVPTSGRSTAGLERVVGYFVNPVALRLERAGESSFAEVLDRRRRVAVEAFEHQDYPFGLLTERLRLDRDPSRSPLFQTLFVLHRTRDPEERALALFALGLVGQDVPLGDLRMQPVALGEGRVPYDLTLSAAEVGEGIVASIQYNRDLFDGASIERMLGHFVNLLRSAVEDPSRRIGELALLGEEERRQLLHAWNFTDEVLPEDLSPLADFELRARRFPDEVAVVSGGEALSYCELDRRANCLARHLVAQGVGPEVLVGISLERTSWLVVAFLAVLKSGGAYVPLDPRHPRERLALILEDARPAVVITEESLRRDGAAIERWSGEPVGPRAGGENLAYVIFTSGSTGRPKGVQIPRRALVNFLRSLSRRLGLGGQDVLLAVTTPSFDIAALELLLPLSVGARVEIATAEEALDPALLGGRLSASGVTVLQSTPATWTMLVEAGWEGDRRLTALCGGEALPASLARELLRRVGSLWNLYGPTETTIWSAAREVGEGEAPVLIGGPIANTRLYVLSPWGEPVPVGVPGELYIGGLGLGRGYLGRPELTAEKFVPDPFAGAAGARMYRVGDLARWRPGGTLEFLGRADHQVKIRGFRIELGEIERAFSSCPGVRQAVVVAREDGGARRLVAYAVPEPGLQPGLAEVRSYVGRSLPDYMLPSSLVLLPTFPLTPNGKVDRRALPVPEAEREESRGTAPRTPVEELLASIWGEILGLERVGREESFFDLGGHSLLATQAISRVRRLLGVDLPLRSLFEAPTLSGMAARIEESLRHTGAARPAPALVPVPRGEALPLSFAQERLWFLDQLNPGSAAYNMPGAVRLTEALDVEALRSAGDAIVRRHEALRTVFPEREGRGVQIAGPPAGLPMILVDLSVLETGIRQNELDRLLAGESRRPFALSRGPLIRAALMRLSETEHVLSLVLHHIVSDGWSLGVLVNELAALYEAFSRREHPQLAELPVQYADYAVWQRAWLQGEVLEEQLGVWRRRLADLPPQLDLPADRSRRAHPSHRGGLRSFGLEAGLVRDLERLGRECGVTPFMILLAGFQAVLSRWTGRTDVPVGSPIANRNRWETEGLIGLFVNSLVLRGDLSGSPSFLALLERTREVTLEAYAHQDLPFEKLVEDLAPERSSAVSPLFQVLFVLQNAPRALLELPGITVERLPVHSGMAQFDLALELSPAEEGLAGTLEFSRDLFDSVTMARLAESLGHLLRGAVATPEHRISGLPLLGEAERHQVLREWSGSGNPRKNLFSIVPLFERQVDLAPDAPALTAGGRTLTYRQLDLQANRLAWRLRRLGAGPDVPVAVLAERSPELIVALLGILKAGGAYVPLDPSYPQERLFFMVEDCKAPILLTQEHLAGRLSFPAPSTLFLDAEGNPDPGIAGRPPLDFGPDHLAYVIYTSGSTGRPKGVMVSHQALASYTETVSLAYGLGLGERMLQFCSISFDISLEEIVPCLASGAELVLRTDAMLESVATFLETCRAWSVTVMSLPTAYWHEIVAKLETADLSLPPDLRLIIIAGERVLPERLAAWRRHAPGGRPALINTYGLTESTIISTIGHLTHPRPGEEVAEASIGRVIPDTELHLFDSEGAPVPIGVPGEIHIGGGLLARGYQNHPGLTAERFVPHPFPPSPGARLYRTGDMGRMLPDGEMQFLGRRDRQVKVRGYRIELEEIEARLLQHPEVESAVAVVWESQLGEKRIAGYVVPRPGRRPGTADLREFLRQRLPDYMVPGTFVLLDALPLTPNGKVDRQGLPAPSKPGDTPSVVAWTPVEEIVAAVWEDVLGVPEVGSGTGFFEAGGHSLAAVQVASRLRRVFGVDLPLRRIFEVPTVAGLAREVERARSAGTVLPDEPITPTPRTGELPLSFSQQRLWFIHQLEPESSVYNIAAALRIRGDLDLPALGATLSEIRRRHKVLRTVFRSAAGGPVQEVQEPALVPLPCADLSALPGGAAQEETQRLLAREERRPFDLCRGPVLRALVLRTGPSEHVLSLVLHHIAGDGWSLDLLVRELTALYPALREGKPSPLAELPLQYTDFAVWQRERFASSQREAGLTHWKTALAGLPENLNLPTDRPRPARQSFRGAVVSSPVSPELAASLAILGRREGVTLFMIFLSAFATLLGRTADQEDVAIGSPVANRNRPEIESLIGFFVNTLVLRVDLSGEPGFQDLLVRVREVTLGAFTHQDLPFERLVEELAPRRDLGRTPLFQVAMTLDDMSRSVLELEALSMEPMPPQTVASHFDLTLGIEKTPGGLAASLVYCADLWDPATVRALLSRFLLLLAGAAAGPERGIRDLPLWSEAEREQFLREWNDTGRVIPELPVHRIFEQVAASSPGAVALVGGGRTLSYAELDARANQLARYLRSLGAGTEERVAILLDRSPELILAILATLKAGGVYVPLDPEEPSGRLAGLLEDVEPKVVITREPFAAGLPLWLRSVCLNRDWPAISRQPTERLPDGAGPDNLAYVMYTSGSTGRPKGVAIPHRGVVRLVRPGGYAALGPSEVFLQLAPVSFDASTFEIWGALLNGARLVLYPGCQIAFGQLAEVIRQQEVTTLWLTAGLFHKLVEEDPEALRPVRQVLAGGDVLSPSHVRRALSGPEEGRVVINGYGPTESTTFTCCHRMTRPEEVTDPVSLGRPIANTSIHVVDRRLRPVPPGIPGELLIGGDGLARGYWNQPVLTAERFIPDGLSGAAGGRLYRTGDLVRQCLGGSLEFLGRIDRQVKIRGFRVETGEVEAALAEHPGVSQCVVAAPEGPGGDRRLVAWVVLRDESYTALDGLRGFLESRLPRYMVPAILIPLPALPLTANGKVDRRALSAPESLPAMAEGRVAPRNPLEELIAAIWSEVLGIDGFGVHDGFFALGGHSLLATQLVSRLRRAFDVEIPLSALFEAPTVAGLAGAVQAARRKDRNLTPPLRPRPREGWLPLSFSQQRLWFLEQLDPGSPAYNVPVGLSLRGGLDVAAFSAALSGIVRRHESLRTSFPARDGEPEQAVAPPAVQFPLPLVDLSVLPLEVRRSEAGWLLAGEARRPFDLARGPLFRAVLLRLGSQEHSALLVFHHAVGDGWSLGILVREMAALYTPSGRGYLPELPVQYADFALWQREWLRGEALDGELAYWRQRLSGVPALDLPTDRPRPPVASSRGGAVLLRISPELGAGLAGIGQGERATLFMTLLAAFAALLHRLSGQGDFALGTPIANRNRIETENLIGFFVNTLVLRVETAADPTFLDLVRQVRRTALEAYDHQDLPFEKLVEELAPERSAASTPFFQAMMALQSSPIGPLALGDLEVEPIEISTETAKFDLSLALAEKNLHGVLEFRRDLFDAATAQRLARRLVTLIAGAVESPGRPLSELPLLDEAERGQLLVEWSSGDGPAEPAGTSIHRLFEEQARRTPEAVALAGEEGEISYAELDRRANRLAHRLRALGVGLESRVALCLERGIEAVVTLLATLKAGGAYAPLDPDQPASRLDFQLADLQPTVLVTLERFASKLAVSPGTAVLCLDREREEIAREPEVGLEAGVNGDSLAYLIYTSGSTGRPKGVAVTHCGVIRLVQDCRFAEIRPADIFFQFVPLPFDVSTFEIWGALLNGARVVLPPPGVLSLEDLGRLFERHRVSILWLTAGLFHQMVEERPENLRSVRQLLAGGDVLSPPHARKALEAMDSGVLINGYGPTENTTFTTCHRMADPGEVTEPVSLGRPIAGTRVFVLDRCLRPVPIGTPGELYTGGAGLARAYWRRPELTAERFVPDPCSGIPGERLYATGDLARWRPSGELEFLGRIDHQVKIRGFRIEVGEIESVLAGHPSVSECAVWVWEDRPGDRRLVAYVVPRTAVGSLAAGALRDFVRTRLPEYMVPVAFVMMESLPLNANGKVDRRALPTPEVDPRDLQGSVFVPPRDPVEEVVAGIWESLLGRTRIGVHDDFFLLGGHSLLATRLASRLRQLFGVEIPLTRIFSSPTVASLAAAVRESRRSGAGPGLPLLIAGPRPESLPLSYAQQRLWLVEQLEPGSPIHNLPVAVRIHGELDPRFLEGSLRGIVRRHEILRTTFASQAGSPVQVVHPGVVLPLAVVDLSTLPEAERELEVGRRLAAETARPFDLLRGPLLRALVVRLAAEEFLLLVTMHHIVSDGWSLGVLLRELLTLYTAALRGEPSPLPGLPLQYADFACWQRRELQGSRLEGLLGYWRRQLEDAPVLRLPADLPEDGGRPFHGRDLPLRIPGDLAGAVKRLAREQGNSLFMALLGVFAVLLRECSGQDDLTVGTPVANRNRAETEDLIGFFVNTLVLRLRLSREWSFRELLAHVREVTLEAYDHQDLPFDKLVEALRPERDPHFYPFARVLFSLQNQPIPEMELPGARLSRYLLTEENGSPTRFALSVRLWEEGGGIEGVFGYNSALFEPATAGRWRERFLALLAELAESPGKYLREVPPLDAAARGQVLQGEVGRAESPLENGLESRRARLASRWEGLSESRRALLARRIRSGGSVAPPPRKERLDEGFRAHLVPLREGRGGAPLFLVHPIGGTVFCYRELTRCLGPGPAVYGLQASGVDAGEPCREVERLASLHLEMVRSVDPAGPYVLAGWSFGGTVAFEMARQLRDQGREVKRLVLFDSWAPLDTGGELPRRDEADLLFAFIRDLEGIHGQPAPFSEEELWRVPPGERLAFLLERIREARLLPGEVKLANVQRLLATYKAHLEAFAAYRPQGYPGRITLFLPRTSSTDAPGIAANGWEGLATEGIDVQFVPGDHYSMLSHPNVEMLAERLRACLADGKPSRVLEGRAP